jgi:hypothetical protein
MMESAASIKKGVRREHRIPRLGSKLREFYDSLHRAADAGGFVPRLAGDDIKSRNVQIHQLTVFYGLDIATIRKSSCASRLKEKAVVDWRLKGAYVGRDYFYYELPEARL